MSARGPRRRQPEPAKPGKTRKPGKARKSAKPAKPERESSWSDVVVAVLRDGERVLVTRRPKDAHLGDHDEFPGGRREAGETLEAACVREVKEEVGLDVEIEKLLQVAWFEGGGRRLALSFFQCRCRGPTELAPKVVSERAARWVPLSELPSLHFPPANDAVIKLLAPDAQRRGEG